MLVLDNSLCHFYVGTFFRAVTFPFLVYMDCGSTFLDLLPLPLCSLQGYDFKRGVRAIFVGQDDDTKAPKIRIIKVSEGGELGTRPSSAMHPFGTILSAGISSCAACRKRLIAPMRIGSDSKVLFVTSSGTTDLGEGIISCKRSTSTSLKLISTPLDVPRCTNIICTMGPKCWDEEMMSKLLDAGMDVIRLNFSHGSHEAHQEVWFRVCCLKPRAHIRLAPCAYVTAACLDDRV